MSSLIDVMDKSNQAFRFGSQTNRIRAMPHSGKRISCEKINMGLTPPNPYEAGFIATRDSITINLGPLQGARAIDSDRLRDFSESPSWVHYHPVGSEVYIALPDNRSECLSINLCPSIRQAVLEDYGLDQDLLTTSRRLPPTPEILEFAQLARRYILGEQHSQLVMESLGMLGCSILVNQVSDKNLVPQTAALAEKKLQLIFDFVEANLDQNIGLDDLASHCGLTSFHFARSFKVSTGSTPHQFILERRVARARAKLLHGQQSLAEIALEVGFSSQAHMTGVFRKSLGVTPGRYRKIRQA